MTPELFEHLLWEPESNTLDFKRDQYRFTDGTDEERSELLKEILAFANSWRRSDAHILIGVEEVRGGRSVVVGVTEHLPEHVLQQFVRGHTNVPVSFSYRPFDFEGKSVGVIRIDQKDRPVFARKKYGKVERHAVYFRRGSSTAVADPTEVAKMGVPQADREAEIAVRFADPIEEKAVGTAVTPPVRVLHPSDETIPYYRRSEFDGWSFARPSAVPVNERYYFDRLEYEFFWSLCRPLRLLIENDGPVAARDVRVEAVTGKEGGVQIHGEGDMPGKPSRTRNPVRSMPRTGAPPPRPAGHVNVRDGGTTLVVEVECGTIQPGRRIWSDVFYAGAVESLRAEFSVGVFASNRSQPGEVTLRIDFDATHERMTVEKLMSLPDVSDD